jgi:hypothetical protein
MVIGAPIINKPRQQRIISRVIIHGGMTKFRVIHDEYS